MPDLHNSHSESLRNIYPPLPSINDLPSIPALPCAFPPASPKQFVFGGESNDGISRTQFSAAAEEVLAQMNARLPSNAQKLSHELLNGRNVEANKLVVINDQLGEGGWGLASSGAGSRIHRFAAAHEEGFAKSVCTDDIRDTADDMQDAIDHSAAGCRYR